MEFSDSILGAYISKPINIRKFKENNSELTATQLSRQIKNSRITNNAILKRLKSIEPNVDLSNMFDEMKKCETILQKYDFQDIFDSPDTLSSRYLIPIYESTNSSKLHVHKTIKTDLYQTKKTKLYTPIPNFAPRGNIVPGKTLLITVSLYYPFHWVKDQSPDEAVIPLCKKVIQFYDTQTLQDLKNAFKCENVDSEISGDISENPHKSSEFIVNTDLRHALFYINKNIYVDSLPDGKTIAHAKVMKKWAEEKGYPIGDILSMDTQLLDLEVCIGEPYVYQHLGRCEHLFIFNEISFAQSGDCLGQSNYPRLICVNREKLKNCIFCNKSIATIVLVNHNDRTPLTVNHTCDSCFISYNYDSVGDKVSDFKAYRTIKWRK